LFDNLLISEGETFLRDRNTAENRKRKRGDRVSWKRERKEKRLSAAVERRCGE